MGTPGDSESPDCAELSFDFVSQFAHPFWMLPRAVDDAPIGERSAQEVAIAQAASHLDRLGDHLSRLLAVPRTVARQAVGRESDNTFARIPVPHIAARSLEELHDLIL